jgi:hypothetical protein
MKNKYKNKKKSRLSFSLLSLLPAQCSVAAHAIRIDDVEEALI